MSNNVEVQKFTISRTFNAPKSKVWQAFTEGESLKIWWGPKGTMMEDVTLAFRVGGKFHYCLIQADGSEMWGLFVYQDIEPEDKIIFVNSFSNEEGEIADSPFPMAWPKEIYNIITFEEKDEKTTVTLTGGPINATDEEITTYNNFHDNMRGGFGNTLDQLEEYLASQE